MIIVSGSSSWDPDITFICLPGILARGEEQHAPLGIKNLVTFNYNPANGIVLQQVIDWAIDAIMTAHATGNKVVLIGSSLGGVQVPFVLQELLNQRSYDDFRWLKVIMVDPPWGVQTMIGAMCSKFVGKFLMSPLGVLVMPLSMIKVPPKDEFIECPSDDVMFELAGFDMDEPTWRSRVKQLAIRGLTGYSGQLWLSQIRLMIEVEQNGALAKACEVLRFFSVTLVRCDGPGNEVVRQPLAADLHKEAAPSIEIVGVAGVHCGYLQQPDLFRGVIHSVLENF